MSDTPSTPTDTGAPASIELDDAADLIGSLLDPDNDPGTGKVDPKPSNEPDPADDDEDEDDEGESDEEGEEPSEDDESDDEDADEESPAALMLRLPDGSEVPADEAAKGYLRQSDYTRKTQALAEARKEFEQHEAAVRAEREKYVTYLQRFEQQLAEAGEPTREELDRLRASDPSAYAVAVADLQRKRDAQDVVRAEREATEAKMLEEQNAQRRAFVQQERERLLQAVPEWASDEKVAKQEMTDMMEYARDIGFTDAELASVVDSRTVLLLRDAHLYRKAKMAKPELRKKVASAPVAKPTAAPKPGKQSARKKERHLVRERLKTSGHIDDAAAAIGVLGLD